ncbi:tetratricopeptide-like helical domain-containing protein, partial [Tanacetum coccineum]
MSSLIDLYGKCEMVVKAKQVFDMAGVADVVLWTSMLGVYGRNGHHKEVIRLFKEMLARNVRPDGVAFVTVISACGRTGQVDLGTEYFKSMARDFGLNPSPEHYGCLVDLFCRAGELGKAWHVVNNMPNNVNASVSVWGALLSACCDHGHFDFGKFAAQRALELDPTNTGVYVLLSNMYAKHGLWDEIEQLRILMHDKGLTKDTWSSRIQVTMSFSDRFGLANLRTIASELGGYVHIHDKMYNLIYPYDVQDKTISIFSSKFSPLSHLSMWECVRLEGDLGEAMCTLQSERERDNEGKKIVVKSVIDNKEVEHPMFGDKYFMKKSQVSVVRPDRACCSRFGWLLFYSSDFIDVCNPDFCKNNLVFFKPFTNDVRKLPSAAFLHILSFSAPPTSPECIIIGFKRGGGPLAYIHLVGWERHWRVLRLGPDVYPSFTPTFTGQD